MQKLSVLLNRSAYLKDLIAVQPDSSRTALALTVGFYLSMFPVLGTTSILCVFVALVFRLNLILLQGLNWLLTPLQLIMVYPFMKTGHMMFYNSAGEIPVHSIKDLFKMKAQDVFLYVIEYLVGGVLSWSLLSVMTGYFLYRLLLKFMVRRKTVGQ